MNESKKSLLDLFSEPPTEQTLGITGSPSSTTEITIDIVEQKEASRIQGQLVYVVVPEEDHHLIVIGQITSIQTRNPWHEELGFRGIIKRQGELPHLSKKADIREAKISVQAVYSLVQDGKAEEAISEASGMLASSPSTGAKVFSVNDEILNNLLARYKDEVIYLGKVFGTAVNMPLWLKHFGSKKDGGAGDTYNIGVFGMTGSGKSGLASYMILGYAKHHQMGILVMDPQGQFTNSRGLPFNLENEINRLGRKILKYSIVSNIKLRKDAKLLGEILKKASFFLQLNIKAAENQDYAVDELAKIFRIHQPNLWEMSDDATLKALISSLVADEKALRRIYSSKDHCERLQQALQDRLDNPKEFEDLLQRYWRPVFDLFSSVDSQKNKREDVYSIIAKITGRFEVGKTVGTRPIVFLNLKSKGQNKFLDDDRIKALIIEQVVNTLIAQAEDVFDDEDDSQGLNCLVVLDEARRYAGSQTDGNDESARLVNSFVDSVKTTRKYGLGWMFITQTVSSLNREITEQLRLNAFGYGLTTGTELNRLRELVSDDSALKLYRSFVDPQVIEPRQYSFMITGPASPLSFTGAPLFLNVYNDFKLFEANNPTFFSK